MSKFDSFQYGLIFAKCCANCVSMSKGTWFASREKFYCKLKAEISHQAIDHWRNRVEPNGVCLSHKYDSKTSKSIDDVGFKSKKHQSKVKS